MDQRPHKQAELPKPQPVKNSLNLNMPSHEPLHMPRKRKMHRWLVLVPLIIVTVIAIAIVAAIAWYQSALGARSASTTPISVQVESGATIDQVAQELEQKGVIKSALAFTLYTKLHNKAVVKTGTYTFAPNQTVAEIVGWLNDGKVGIRKITILPGKILKEIKQDLIASGYAANEIDAAFAKHYTHPLFADKPADASLEGYIFPETYFVESGSSVESLLLRTFDQFQKHITDDNLKASLAAKGFTVYQGITLASIVAKEVTNANDQKQVAQVFETRLQQNMALGSDVTYHYAATQLGVEPSPTIASPYNTRIHAGLPPGPIANFNLSALRAVANPLAGNYLFFVAGDDGVTHFATTNAEHEQNIQKYCQKLCASN